jgi:hypothetical protein
VEHAFKPKFEEKRDSTQYRLPATHAVNNAVTALATSRIRIRQEIWGRISMITRIQRK